ncbi:hypothetical protein DCS_01988 [Drechmeria coniospora]|uniref:Uncharacterized protein n=1 Tax=Drechmeria coniospora TaxID=98403 RepID=A0A151GUU8_DRECN|nr:hypothetical protein DCS_01988 [Drechmeria coniospora]KYK60850.1 hypothetical protein DCS_01988 [Drechmeria coniospora]ODA83545.1 hypothetical protein RJ55_02059 [Drechmeria coniospora]
MRIIQTLILVTSAVRVSCLGGRYYRAIQDAVDEELLAFTEMSNLGADPLHLSETSLPFQDELIITESTCWHRRSLFTCTETTFFNRTQLVHISGTTFHAIRHQDQGFSAHYEPSNVHKVPSKIVSKQSTAVMKSTTRGWKIGLKMSHNAKVGQSISLTGEGTYELHEQSTQQKTVTTEVSVEHACPDGYRCTIETLSFYASVRGTCRVQPTTHCADKTRGEQDACLGFNKINKINLACYDSNPAADELTHGARSNEPIFGADGKPLQVPEWDDCSDCDQFHSFARRHCHGRDRHPEEQCEISVPVVKANGMPYTHIIFTRLLLEKYAKKHQDNGKDKMHQDNGKDKREVKEWGEPGRDDKIFVQALRRGDL